jgi:hypothetical protein
MPSTWLQKARRLPCLALTRSLCVWLCCQPASRSHFAFVRARALAICPELFACCARSDCTAPCRGAGTPLLAAEAHTSATTADLSTPPPHPSPSLCSRQESSRHTGPASVARACRAARAASLSLTVAKVHWWRYEAPEGHPRLCCRRNLPSGDLLHYSGWQSGDCCFVLFAHRLMSNQGYRRDSSLKVRALSVMPLRYNLYILAGCHNVLDSELR